MLGMGDGRKVRAASPTLDDRRGAKAAYARKKGMALKAIAKALTQSEESVKDRAKADGLGIAKLR